MSARPWAWFGNLMFVTIMIVLAMGMRTCIHHVRRGQAADQAARRNIGCWDVACDANGDDRYLCRCRDMAYDFRVFECDIAGWEVPGRDPLCRPLDDMGGNPWR